MLPELSSKIVSEDDGAAPGSTTASVVFSPSTNVWFSPSQVSGIYEPSEKGVPASSRTNSKTSSLMFLAPSATIISAACALYDNTRPNAVALIKTFFLILFIISLPCKILTFRYENLVQINHAIFFNKNQRFCCALKMSEFILMIDDKLNR